MTEAERLATRLERSAVGGTYINEAAALLRSQAAEIERLTNHIHTCGPNCTKAGCMNKELRAEIERLNAKASVNFLAFHETCVISSKRGAERDALRAEIELLRNILISAVEVVYEAQSYTDCETHSPSMTLELINTERAMRHALDVKP
jgi:hypothetical protein